MEHALPTGIPEHLEALSLYAGSLVVRDSLFYGRKDCKQMSKFFQHVKVARGMRHEDDDERERDEDREEDEDEDEDDDDD